MSEKSEIKRLGAIPVKNSGRGTNKGDAVLPPFLVDVKEYNQSFSVSRKNWAKISTDAIARQDGSQPMFVLALGEEGKTPIRLWVMSEKMGMEMYQAWKEKYEGEV